MNRRHAVALIFGGVACVLLLGASDPAADGNRWWSYVTYLASDKLQGRDTGSEGYHQAAVYVAGEFERMGLKPAGESGYFQPVKFKSREIVENRSSLALEQNGARQPLTLGEDASFSMRVDPAPALEARMVFAGYGLAVPELHYDDLAGLDLRGKIMVYVSGGPATIPGPLSSHYQSMGERGKFLERAGVAGVCVVPNPAAMDIPWARMALARFQPSMSLDYSDLAEGFGLKVGVTINPARFDKWLAGSGHTADEIFALAKDRKTLPRFELKPKLIAKVEVSRKEVQSPNVAAILAGTDPKLKDEYVVLSAHLDHVGVGRPINGDSIYNGAMDDASGVATLLDIAGRLHRKGAKLRRSVLFLTVTGEEKGLLGSKYFAAHPTIPAASIVADLNVDMFLPLFPLHILTVYGLDESSLGAQAREVAARSGVEVQGDLEPQRNIFIRSDQYNFIRQGVPAVAFKVGYKKGTPEEATAKKWLTERYHAPSDDIRQPVDLKAAADFDSVIMALVEAVANASERPKWNNDSFFRRFAHSN